MPYTRYFIWVEGDDDERFVKRVIKPILDRKYDYVEIISYASMALKKIKSYLESLRAMGARFVYLTDIDSEPCVTAKKGKLRVKRGCIEEERIVVIIKEIESWYFAGLNLESMKEMKIPDPIGDMSYINKEEFHKMIPGRYDSRIDFMSEILKRYSIEMAKKGNSSFKYFMEKHVES